MSQRKKQIHSFALIQEIKSRALTEGGFSEHHSGDYRPDATAWAVLALQPYGEESRLLENARRRLSLGQLKDGRVCVSPETPETFWPTPLALLAWLGSKEFEPAAGHAVNFLLATAGEQYPKEISSPVAHDTTLRGWPWSEGTHSWVEPTALAMVALCSAGLADHPRIGEATELMLDRQLSSGGWNYGNTSVYGHELHPAPDSTGIALLALAGKVPRQKIAASVGFLKKQTVQLFSPHSLAWALIGLHSWGESPDDAESLIAKCIDQQKIFGPYTTTQLCTLLQAVNMNRGITAWPTWHHGR